MKWLARISVALAIVGASVTSAADSANIDGRVTVNPLSVSVTRPTEPLRRGRWFRVTAEVSNAGSTSLNNVSVTLVRPAALLIRGAPATQTIARIPARATRRARWDACSNTVGSYVILARAAVGSFTAESPGVVVQIQQSNRTC